jgi:hypothetical protein
MSARKRGLSSIVWLVLVCGAVMIIIFTYFFRVESARTQTLLTMVVALFVSLNLLLVKLFENPYRNELLIKKGAFYFKPSVFDTRKTLDMKVEPVPAEVLKEGDAVAPVPAKRDDPLAN